MPSSLIEKACTFNDYKVGTTFDLGDVTVRTGKLNHPNGAWVIALSAAVKQFYMYSTEHFEDRLDENVLELADQADIIVYDAAHRMRSIQISKVGTFNLARSHQGCRCCKQAKLTLSP